VLIKAHAAGSLYQTRSAAHRGGTGWRVGALRVARAALGRQRSHGDLVGPRLARLRGKDCTPPDRICRLTLAAYRPLRVALEASFRSPRSPRDPDDAGRRAPAIRAEQFQAATFRADATTSVRSLTALNGSARGSTCSSSATALRSLMVHHTTTRTGRAAIPTTGGKEAGADDVLCLQNLDCSQPTQTRPVSNALSRLDAAPESR
jgi:hypothetical protein